MSAILGLDLDAVIYGLSQARAEDFVRHVQRRMREDATLSELRFKDGWLICLGSYAELLSAPEPSDPEDDEPLDAQRATVARSPCSPTVF